MSPGLRLGTMFAVAHDRLVGSVWGGRYAAPMKTVRLRVAGQVQGVGYRAWAVRIAAELGLRGWVRNRADGSVELLASGTEAAIAALIAAARHGPRAAHVRAVQIADAEDEGSLGFSAYPSL